MGNTPDISTEAVERQAANLEAMYGLTHSAALLRALRAALDEAQRDTQRLDAIGKLYHPLYGGALLRQSMDAETDAARPVEGSSQQ